MAKTGAPRKRGRKRAAIILAALERGNSFKAAAGLAGISEESLLNWRKDSLPFSAKVDAARAVAEQKAVERMNLDPNGWRFALERQYGWIEHKHMAVENLAGVEIIDDEAPEDQAPAPAPPPGRD